MSPDSSLVITTTTTTVSKEIWQTLSPMLWVLLFSGWFSYWCKMLNEKRIGNPTLTKREYLKSYFDENWIELPFSFFSCFMFAILSHLPPSTMDSLMIQIFVFQTGYASSSIINTLVTHTQAKDKIVSIFKKPTQEV